MKKESESNMSTPKQYYSVEYQLKVQKEFDELMEKQKRKMLQRKTDLELLIEAYDEIDAQLLAKEVREN